ncbi:MAG: Eukaryotic translation initiation factor eIF-1 [Watsoniomyces obsoletus]|nr:MAG: Eukaryotic translation initiation factor eIF-1 [Watsoniomyces obsoletus]
MASKKDMRREDLVVPYMTPPKKESEGDLSALIATTLPMAALFTRNKVMGWSAVLFAVQHWLSESPEQRATATQPAYLSVGLSLMALTVTYFQMFFPPPNLGNLRGTPPTEAGTGTEAPPAVPPSFEDW